MSTQQYIPLILERLKQADPVKVVLFGSHVTGDADSDSDIDILVVTSDNYIPENFKEKISLELKISSLISDIKKECPVDLIVHTIPMHDKFLALGSMFSKEITQKGQILYERDHQGMA